MAWCLVFLSITPKWVNIVCCRLFGGKVRIIFGPTCWRYPGRRTCPESRLLGSAGVVAEGFLLRNGVWNVVHCSWAWDCAGGHARHTPSFTSMTALRQVHWDVRSCKCSPHKSFSHWDLINFICARYKHVSFIPILQLKSHFFLLNIQNFVNVLFSEDDQLICDWACDELSPVSEFTNQEAASCLTLGCATCSCTGQLTTPRWPSSASLPTHTLFFVRRGINIHLWVLSVKAVKKKQNRNWCDKFGDSI